MYTYMHKHRHTDTHTNAHTHTKLCTYMTLICSGPHTPSSTEGVTTPQYPCLRLVAAIQSTWRTGGLCHCGPKTVKWGLEHDACRLRYICTKQMQKTNVAHMFDSREVLCSSSSLNYKQNSLVSLWEDWEKDELPPSLDINLSVCGSAKETCFTSVCHLTAFQWQTFILGTNFFVNLCQEF